VPLAHVRAALKAIAGSTFSSLAVPDYRRLYFGNMAFQFSNWMQQLTFGWLLLTIGDSPFWLGVSGSCYAVAMITMGPVGGALADAWERRRVMMLTQMTVVVVNAAIALLYWLGWLQIWHLLAAAILMGFSFTLNMPARQSLMAELVPRRLLHNATAIHTASMNLSRITGPAIAGALMAAIGALPVLLINLAGNAWTVRQLTEIRYRPPRPPKPFRLHGSELLEGFHHCWRQSGLLEILAVVAATNFFGLSYVYLLPSLARDELGVGPAGLGLLTSSMGGGALVGSLVLARRTGVPHKERFLGIAATILGLLLFGLGHAGQLPFAMGALGLIGATSSVITALGLAAIQERVPDELSGRVFGIYMLTMGLMPLGSLPAGALATWLGTAGTISTWGLACALVSACLLAPRLLAARRLHSEPARLSS
jgi:MFS family permease